jgi:hypothetical protein
MLHRNVHRVGPLTSGVLAATLLDVDEVCCAVSAAEFWRQSRVP